MKIKITGIDSFTTGNDELIEIEVDLSVDDFKIYHSDYKVEIFVNDDREIVTKESFKIQ